MAAPHIALGKRGEALAAEFLREQGGEVLHQNYRWSRAEIDLIVRYDNILHFVEVKTRRWQDVDAAASAVGRVKQQNVMAAAGRYMEDIAYAGDFQFDVVVVLLDVAGNTQISWRQDAFGFFD